MTVYPNGLRSRPTVTSIFGWRTHPVTKVRTFHYGVDSVGHPKGFNYACRGGTVIWVGYTGGGGNEIWVKDSDGHIWEYKHHKSGGTLVREGQQVSEGQPLGVTGTTGASTGVHCHLGLRDGGRGYVEPYGFIASTLSPAGGSGIPIEPEQEDDMQAKFFIASDNTGLAFGVGNIDVWARPFPGSPLLRLTQGQWSEYAAAAVPGVDYFFKPGAWFGLAFAEDNIVHPYNTSAHPWMRPAVGADNSVALGEVVAILNSKLSAIDDLVVDEEMQEMQASLQRSIDALPVAVQDEEDRRQRERLGQ